MQRIYNILIITVLNLYIYIYVCLLETSLVMHFVLYVELNENITRGAPPLYIPSGCFTKDVFDIVITRP